ncbi:MAG: hypothetical protein ABJB66_11225, partial [Gemmatimonadaceae bacterium]
MRRTSRDRVLWLVSLAALTISPLPAHTQTASTPAKDRIALTDYLDWEDVAAPSLSPDGKLVIYTRTVTDKI